LTTKENKSKLDREAKKMVVSANVKEDAPTSLTKNNEAAALQMM
jgi:hypothetical protein